MRSISTAIELEPSLHGKVVIRRHLSPTAWATNFIVDFVEFPRFRLSCRLRNESWFEKFQHSNCGLERLGNQKGYWRSFRNELNDNDGQPFFYRGELTGFMDHLKRSIEFFERAKGDRRLLSDGWDNMCSARNHGNRRKTLKQKLRRKIRLIETRQ